MSSKLGTIDWKFLINQNIFIIFFSIDIDPTIRHSLFTVLIGGFIIWLGDCSTSQLAIQRFQSLPTLKGVKTAAIYFTGGIIVLYMFCMYNGFLLYATYWDCDPLTTKLAKERDQLVPLLVMKTLGDYPGLTGCFVAGVFSAAMSSLSTALNALSAVVLEDFLLPSSIGPKITENATSYILRGTVIIFGCIAVALVSVVEQLGQVLQLSYSLGSTGIGPMFGIFTAGLLLPFVKSKHVLIGAGAGMMTLMWIVLRAQTDIALGVLTFETKETSVEGCLYSFNITAESNFNKTVISDTVKPLHHISYLYYTPLGALITVSVAVLSSYFIKSNDPERVDPQLLATFIRKWYVSKGELEKDPNFGEKIYEFKNVETIENDIKENGVH